jgi:putative transposase
VERYEFIRILSADFSIATLCELMEVSRTAYYRYLRGASYQPATATQEQLKAVEEIFWQHKRRYGQRRILVDLQELGYSLGRHRVRSLMQQQGLVAIQPRSFVPRTTDSRHGKRICDNLLLGQPLPTKPNLVWVSDITYLPLVNGRWAYLGSWMDLYSRMVVGWRVEEHMEDTLIINALKQGLYSRQPDSGLIAHSDRGGQYVSDELRKLIKDFQICQSMSRADDPYDNAFAESFWSRFKAEVLEGGAFLDVADARTEIFDYIEVYYNRVRRHSSLGYKSPLQFESDYYLKLASQL